MAKAKTTPKTEVQTTESQVPEFASTLADVIAATKADNFVYTPSTFHAPLIESGDVVINDSLVDANGWIATRATDKAMNMTTEQATSTVTEKPKFEIEDGIAIPVKVRAPSVGNSNAGRKAIYPFDQLEVGKSFFVPNGVDKEGKEKSAFKSMTSSIAGANAKNVEEIPGQTRVNRAKETVPATKQLKFFRAYDTEREITVDGAVVKQKGARIFRMPLDENGKVIEPTA